MSEEIKQTTTKDIIDYYFVGKAQEKQNAENIARIADTLEKMLETMKNVCDSISNLVFLSKMNKG